MLSNPTNGSADNLQSLFGLTAGLGAPFQPSLSAAPSDWSISIAYSSSSPCGTGHGSFINAPQDINLDETGNLWIANGQATSGNLSEISSNGTPTACVFLGGGNSRGSTIDTQGNIWYGTTAANNIYSYNPSNGSILSYTTAAPPLAVTADGSGNVYFSTTTDGSLYEIAGAANATPTAPGSPTSVATSLGTPGPPHTGHDRRYLGHLRRQFRLTNCATDSHFLQHDRQVSHHNVRYPGRQQLRHRYHQKRQCRRLLGRDR